MCIRDRAYVRHHSNAKVNTMLGNGLLVNLRSNFSQQGRMMEIHLAHQLRSLNLVQIIIFYKLKLTTLSTFCKHLTRGEGGPSWMRQNDKDEGPNSGPHRAAVVNDTTHGKV